MQSLDDLYGGGRLLSAKAGISSASSMPIIRPSPRTSFRTVGCASISVWNSLGQMAAQRNGVLREPIAFDDLQRLERMHADQRRTAKGGAVRARPSKSCNGSLAQIAPIGRPAPRLLAMENASG